MSRAAACIRASVRYEARRSLSWEADDMADSRLETESLVSASLPRIDWSWSVTEAASCSA